MDTEKLRKISQLANRIETTGSITWIEVADYARKIQQLADEILSETEEDKVRVFDNGGSSFDRYTVFIGKAVYTMSSHPLSPQGMNQWAGKDSDFEGPNGFEISSGLLREDEVPPEVREAIEIRKVQALAKEDGK